MKRLLLSLLLLVAVNATMSAYDFEVDGKYYNLLSDSTAEFTCKDPNYTAYRGHLVIPETVSYNGVDLTVTQVSDYACYKCRQMTSVSIPNTVTSLGVSSFLGCSGLTSIDLPNSLTRIGSTAFEECSELTSLYLPSSVTKIEPFAFMMCPGLTSIVVADDNPKYDSRGNCNAVIETATKTMIIGCQNTVIPSSVTTFADHVFEGVTGLTSIVIPYGTTEIPDYMLAFCTNLTSVQIPNTVTSIGYDAFRGCTSIANITLPNSVRVISYGAFSEMDNLQGLKIPRNVYSIRRTFLLGSPRVKRLSVADGNQYYDSREDCNAIIHTSTNTIIAGCENTVIPSTVTSIGANAFGSRLGLTSIDIPNHITSIDEYAFARCVNLTHVTLPDSITNIADYMFYECGALESITIPAPVTDIGLSAFRYCSNLTQVISLPVTPPAITQYCFINSYGATLFVPQESMEAYSTHEFWGRFSRIVPFLGAGPGDINGDGTITVSDAVDIINQMLDAGNDELPAYGDVNGDGTINIADITILINMLLNATN